MLPRLLPILTASLWLLPGHEALAMPSPSPAACANILPDGKVKSGKRSIEPLDLVQLRDLGYMHLAPSQRLLSLSPDRKRAAFVLHQASANSNRYCVALMLLDVERGGAPRVLDLGDDLISDTVSIRGVEVEYGLPTVIVPLWSPDGSQLAYLKKRDGKNQVYTIDLASGAVQQASRSEPGAEHFAWSADGRSIIYSDRPELLTNLASIEAEAATGYLVDDRIVPYANTRPAIPTPKSRRTLAVDLAEGRERALTAEEANRLDMTRALYGTGGEIAIDGSDGWKLAKRQAIVGSYASPTRLVATRPDGRSIECDEAACRGTLLWDIEGAWETDRPGEFAFLKQEGWGGSRQAIYIWQPGERVRRLLSTTDLLVGCESLGSRLLCARESALEPRHLVSFDLHHGGQRELVFDPNPEFSGLDLGKARRLEWRNLGGQESFGDLVLPPESKSSDSLPMVVVQYTSRGFLRGGTGDEYPIQLLARAGFAVLSLQKPSALYAIEQSDGTIEDISRIMSVDWADRKNIHSSLVTGIAAAESAALIDRTRIGITGVSDASTTTQYALINSPGLFKAASIGSCCVDPTSMMIYAGPGVAKERRAWGFPPATGPGSEAWKPLALVMNPPERMVPMLMQLADNEFIISMETIAAYKGAGRPIEARIFPNEFHLKIQPEHRLAIYRRNVQWFEFWLSSTESANPVDPDQYVRWNRMRKALGAK